MIAEGLFSHLSGDAGVAALASSRIYPLLIPQHVYDEVTKLPCIVYQQTSSMQQQKTCGTDSLQRTEMQIDNYARTYMAAHQLSDAVRNSLIDFSGAWGAHSISEVHLDWQMDSLDIEPGLYRVVQRWFIWHT